MSTRGLNPDFVARVHRKRAQAEMRAMIAEAEQRAAELDRAAREAADAILDAAYEEARIIMRRAKETREHPFRSLAEIIGEVGKEFSVAPSLIRTSGGIGRVRQARRAAICRAVEERPDMSGTEIARIFRADPTTINAEIRRQREARHG